MIDWKLSTLLMLVLLTVASCGSASNSITTVMPAALTAAPATSSTLPSSSVEPPAQPPSSHPPAADTSATISFTPLIQGAASGGHGEHPSLFVVQRDSQRALLTAQISSEQIPAVNAVDLSSYIIVAAFQGLQPTSGYQIEIVTIQAVQGILTVTVNVTAPQLGAPVRQGFETPYHLVQIARDQFDPARTSRYQLRDTTGAVLAEGAIAASGRQAPLEMALTSIMA
jgi:hypothetical protein